VLRQKWELPEVVALVIEHRLHRLVCPGCGTAVLAEGDGISASAFGPRLEAHVAVMSGVYRLSRRQIVELLCEMFGTTVSVGAVNATIMRMSAMLSDPWRELRDAVRKAQAVHADETSWRLRGETNWLWVAASALMACYRIDPARSQAAAKELLGEDFGSFIITDRYAGYHWLDVLQQQLCWCHAIRQFVSVSERDGAPGRLGHQLLAAAREVIRAHREYLQDGHDLTWLRAQLAPYRQRIKALLEQGVRGRHLKTRRFCAGLLDEYDALWTFCEVEGIDPDKQRRGACAQARGPTTKDPARHPIGERQPLDRTDLHRPRDLPPARPLRARLPPSSRDRRPAPPADPIADADVNPRPASGRSPSYRRNPTPHPDTP
jgi:hypothetical protein